MPNVPPPRPSRPLLTRVGVAWLALLAPLAVLLLAYPAFLTLSATPLSGSTAIVHDTWCAFITFLPGHRALHWALTVNKSLLWSNLRGLGLPLLAGEIQAAPLFPLTLALAWLPEDAFWPALAACRLIATGAGSWLIARSLMGLRPLAAFTFMMAFGFATYHLRWINHPVANGLAASVWYLFFAGKYLQLGAGASVPRRLGLGMGTAVAAYALATCGFPESTVIAAILATLVLAPLALARLAADRGVAWGFWLEFMVAHAAGALLALPQLLAMLELMGLAAKDFRSSVALVEFSSPDFMLAMLTRVAKGVRPGPIMHYFGLIPTSLCLIGLADWARGRRTNAFDAGAWASLGFFVLKNFGLAPWFSRALAALPVLSQTYFTVYGFGLFLWFFAYFAARGGEALGRDQEGGGASHRTVVYALVLFLAVAGPVVLWLVWHADPSQREPLRAAVLVSLWCLVAFVAIGRPAPRLRLWGSPGNHRLGLIAALMLGEFLITRPAITQGDHDSGSLRRLGAAVVHMLDARGIPAREVREHSGNGNLIWSGIASMDGGYAVLPERLSLFRTALFATIAGDPLGLFPITAVKRPDAWRIAAVNLHITSPNRTLWPYQGGADAGLAGAPLGAWGDAQVFYDDQALGRAFQPRSCRLAASAAEAQHLLADQAATPLGTVVIEAEAPEARELCLGLNQPYAKVPLLLDQGDRVQLGTVMGPTVVVLNDTIYPGWHASERDTGAEIAMFPANVAFRAVLLPKARAYNLDFVYKPEWWRRGAAR